MTENEAIIYKKKKIVRACFSSLQDGEATRICSAVRWRRGTTVCSASITVRWSSIILCWMVIVKSDCFAWSMGVWVAGQILSGHTYPWEMKLAVNGTPFPIDDRRGIAEAVFHGTLENFSDAALARFRRRICGGAGQVKEFLSHQPYRTTEELGAELAALEHEAGKVQPAAFVWDKAIIGLCDKIFIPANQRAAWTGTEVMEMEAEHYDTVLFDRLLEGKGEEWTRR